MDDCHTEKMEEPGQNVDLPPEIVHDIIPRLPVKPLCRFKLVSNSWQSLINDPYFVANYYKSIENKDVFFSRRRLLFTCKRRIYSLDLDQFLNENRNAGVDGLVAAPTELDFVGKNTFLHASCNGLFLFYVCSPDQVFSLINPVTKESKELPKPPIWTGPMLPLHRLLYGVGYDHSTDEYKVINMKDYGDGMVFSVYTLQTDSWRQIDYLFPGYITSSHTDEILVNGAIIGWRGSMQKDHT